MTKKDVGWLTSFRGDKWRSERCRLVTHHQFGSFQTPRLGPSWWVLRDIYRIDRTWIIVASTWGHNGWVEPSAAGEPPGPGTVQSKQWLSERTRTLVPFNDTHLRTKLASTANTGENVALDLTNQTLSGSGWAALKSSTHLTVSNFG